MMTFVVIWLYINKLIKIDLNLVRYFSRLAHAANQAVLKEVEDDGLPSIPKRQLNKLSGTPHHTHGLGQGMNQLSTESGAATQIFLNYTRCACIVSLLSPY